MIDIHNHILPGVDDGAQDSSESIAMLQMAQADGIELIVATPHHFPIVRQDPSSYASRLRDQIVEKSRTKITVRLGQEIAISEDVPRGLLDRKLLSFEQSQYVLIELPFFDYPDWVDGVLAEICRDGFTPIIAHPERNTEVQKDPNIITAIREKGMLTQINAGSLLGHFGDAANETAIKLLETESVDVIASDAHSAHGFRLPVLSDALELAGRITGFSQVERMVSETPRAIIEGRSLREDVVTKSDSSGV